MVDSYCWLRIDFLAEMNLGGETRDSSCCCLLRILFLAELLAESGRNKMKHDCILPGIENTNFCCGMNSNGSQNRGAPKNGCFTSKNGYMISPFIVIDDHYTNHPTLTI